MTLSKLLVFTKSIPNSGRNLEPQGDELKEIVDKANRAVQELGSGWRIVSAVTNMTHFEMGNLHVIGLVLTVVAERSANLE